MSISLKGKRPRVPSETSGGPQPWRGGNANGASKSSTATRSARPAWPWRCGGRPWNRHMENPWIIELLMLMYCETKRIFSLIIHSNYIPSNDPLHGIQYNNDYRWWWWWWCQYHYSHIYKNYCWCWCIVKIQGFSMCPFSMDMDQRILDHYYGLLMLMIHMIHWCDVIHWWSIVGFIVDVDHGCWCWIPGSLSIVKSNGSFL